MRIIADYQKGNNQRIEIESYDELKLLIEELSKSESHMDTLIERVNKLQDLGFTFGQKEKSPEIIKKNLVKIIIRIEDIMNTILPIAKYNFTEGEFSTPVNYKDRLLALSKITTTVISNEDDDHFDYILFANGNRARDVTKDGYHPFERRDYCQRIAEYFRKKHKNVIIEHILLDNDSPLIKETKMIADYIDDIASEETLDTINIIGHSKCGAELV